MMFPKPRTWRSDTYRQWVRQQRCVIPNCRASKRDAAHVTVKGKSLKADDYFCVPLCRDHHQEQHRVGVKTFEERYNIRLRVEAENLWQRSPWASEIREWRAA